MRVVWGLRYKVGKKIGVSLCRYFKHEDVFFYVLQFHVVLHYIRLFSICTHRIVEQNRKYSNTK